MALPIELIPIIGAVLLGVGLLWWSLRTVRFSRQSSALLDAHRQPGIWTTTKRPEAESQKLAEATDVQAAAETSYRTWLEQETGYIDIRGIGSVGGRGTAAIRPIPILRLYTELYVEQGLTNFALDQGNVKGMRRIALTTVLGATRCLAVMGDPGGGKTTFLRYVATRQLLDRTKALPVYLSLSDVYQFVTASKTPAQISPSVVESRLRIDGGCFLEYLLDLSDKKNLGLDRQHLDEKLSSGGCLWLLDGLDELPSGDAREAMVDAIADAARQWAHCQFVLTSRPLALTGRAVPLGFEIIGIDRMQDEEIKAFLRTWIEVLFDGESKSRQTEYFNQLYSAIKDTPGLRSLAKNPVMLTSIAVLHYNNDKRLPTSKADLLEALIHWLIHERERRLRGSTVMAESTEALYRGLALAMFEHKAGRQNRVGRGWAAEQIARLCRIDTTEALNILTREENETGILVRRGAGDVAFWHFWFQEYLAAKEIAGRMDFGKVSWWAKIKPHLDQAEWHDLLALVPMCLNRLGSTRVDLFFQRLGISCSKADMSTKVRRVGLGGRILRDLHLAGYTGGGVKQWAQILQQIRPIFSAQLPPSSLSARYDAAVAYGLAVDDRLTDFETTWVSLPGGQILMGSQAQRPMDTNYDASATSWEGPVIQLQLGDFELRKYPITVQEFKPFLVDGGYKRQELWSSEGWQWRAARGIEAPGDWEEQLVLLNCPVTAVSWHEAIAYCHWLTVVRGGGRYVYSLPTEAEWEYAVRRGLASGQVFLWGDSLTEGDSAEANWVGSQLRRKSPVGMFPKSTTSDGIVDMIGNVEEWCADAWSADHTGYPQAGGPRVTGLTPYRVVRGGSAIRVSRLCRPTYRSRSNEENRYHTIGFRPARRAV